MRENNSYTRKNGIHDPEHILFALINCVLLNNSHNRGNWKCKPLNPQPSVQTNKATLM